MTEDSLIDKMVIDISGNIIGKCINVRDNEDDENYLIIEIKSEEQGMTKVDVPMSTVQAIGKTIVLAVEIEGLIEDQQILPYEDELESNDDVSKKILEDMEEAEKTHQNERWVLYKSIKSNK